MASLKRKGDRAELEVARDLIARGFRIAFPYGEDWDFDVIFSRDGRLLERAQVKHTTSRNGILEIKCRSASLTNGRVRRVKHYTAATIDWLAAYDPVTDRCYYVPARELRGGVHTITLRLTRAANNQQAGIRYAADYLAPSPAD